MPFDYEGARQAGYSDAEIASFLGAQSGFDTSAALKSGYQPSEIIGFLSQRLAASEKQPTVEDAPVQGDPMGTGFAEIASAPANAPQAGAGRGFVNPPLASQPQPKPQVDRSRHVPTQIPVTDAAGNPTGEMQTIDTVHDPDEVGALESLGRGWGQAGAETAKAMVLAPAVPIAAAEAIANAVTGNSGDTKWQDWYFRTQVDPIQDAVDWYKLKPEEKQSLLAKVASGIGTVTQDLPQMFLFGGLKKGAQLADATPTVARFIEQSLSQGFDAMRSIMVKSGTEKAQQVLDAGGTPVDAAKSALTAALITGFQGAQPMSAAGGIVKRAATGLPTGVVQGEAARVIQNAADPASLQRPFDAENAIVSGVTGSLAAVGLGHQAEAARAVPRDLVREVARDYAHPEETAAKVMGAASVDEAINTATQEAQRTSPAAEAVRAQMAAIRPLREKPEEPAAPEVIRNESGTLTVKGDPKALTKVLEDAGVTAILPAKNGVVVGKSQVELAERALAEFTGARNGLAVPPEPVRASDPGISLPERIDTARPADAVVPAQAQPVAEVPKVAAEPRVEPRPETAGREPAEVWFGRRGDGYQHILDAEAALPSRERARPDLQWMVHDRNGRYYLAGYEEQPHARDAGHVSADVAGASERGNPEPPVGMADRVGVVPARQAVGGLRAEPAQESGAVPLEPGRRADAVAPESIPVEGPAAAREMAGPMDAGEQVAAQVKEPQLRSYNDLMPEEKAAFDQRHGIAPGAREANAQRLARIEAQNARTREQMDAIGPKSRDESQEQLSMFARGERPPESLAEVADARDFTTRETMLGEPQAAEARSDSALKRGSFQIPGRLSHDQAESFVAPLREKWKNGPAIHVTASNAEFPIRVPSDVRGLYYKGEVWVASDAHRDGPQAKRSILSTAAHEAVSHYGLRYMLGQEDWGTLMRQVQLAVKSGNKPLNEIRDYVREHYRNDDGSYAFEKRPLLESDEIAARAVELAIDKDGNFRPGFGMFKAVFAKVAQFLRSIGIDVKFTNAELQGMLVLAMKHLEAGHRAEGARGQVLVGAPAARAEGEGPQAARSDQRTIEVNGERRPIENSAGKPIVASHDVEKLKNFYKWFGDSKVVDEQGRPLVVYHGTTEDVSAFDPKKTGMRTGNKYGKGAMFFTDRPSTASAYATTTMSGPAKKLEDMHPYDRPNVVPAYLALKNPLELDAKERSWKAVHEQIAAASKQGYDGAIVHNVLDHASVLQALADGPVSVYVAFHPEQIKSAIGNRGTFDANEADIRYARGTTASEEEAPRERAPYSGPGAKLLTEAKGAVARLADDVFLKVAPMSSGSDTARAVAKDYANAERLARHQWTRMDDMLRKDFTEAERKQMWEAADEENVERMKQAQDPEYTRPVNTGLDRLNEKQRAAVEMLHRYGEELLQRAKDAGMFKGEGLPYWTPRMAVMIGGDGEFAKIPGEGKQATSAGQGRNVTTTAQSLKQRKYLTAAETEAAASALAKERGGERAQLVRDIRVMPLAMARLERAIAGRELVNQIKALGQNTGEQTVSTSAGPNFFTLDHPAFYTYRPRFVEVDGKVTPALDQNGEMTFDRVPIFISKDFEGPLKAIMSDKSGPAYTAFMSFKAKTMGLIMYSPLIHNAVEWGRAMPVMPGKVLTFRIYFEGNKVKNDPVQMAQAIKDGMVPIGHRGQMQDITGLAEEPTLAPGRSLTAKILGGAIGAVNEKAGESVKKGVDAAGDFWHNTLLWDRVGDLQAGLYSNVKAGLLKKGMDEQTAGRLAAHFANRYAGALPNEAMSANARKIANFVLFSRSFTLGNLGVMKDILTGFPPDVAAQIKRDAGDLALRTGKNMARRKAAAAFMLDIALLYVGNSLLQSAFDKLKRDKSMDEILHGYAQRFDELIKRTKESPLDVLTSPMESLASLTPNSRNEPGKENRILYDTDETGTNIYLRLPTGKIGEEFKDWLTSPLEMLARKQGTVMRPITQTLSNDKGFGQHVYNPDDKSWVGIAKNVGRIVWNFMSQQVPADAVQAGVDWAKGEADTTDKMKVLGPLAGVTFSKGAPGGPAVGEMYHENQVHQNAVADIMPDVRRALKHGDQDKAVELMESVQMTPGEIRSVIRHQTDPESRLSGKAMSSYKRHASEESKQRMEDYGR